MELKPSNPKDAVGSSKIPMHLWPNTATAMGAMGLLDGMLKYGRTNWRVCGVRSSIYYDAAKRHLDRWFEGEDMDPDSGLHHLCHALACLAIITDAMFAGKLNDDRMVQGGMELALKLLTPQVDMLKKKHSDKSPKHYTIADNEEINNMDSQKASSETKERSEPVLETGYICGSCAAERGGVWPMGHCATCHIGLCPYCKQPASLCSIDDWNWPESSYKPGQGVGRD